MSKKKSASKPAKKKKATKKQTKKGAPAQKTKRKMSEQEPTPQPKFETIQQAQEAFAKKEITIDQFHQIQATILEGQPAPEQKEEHPGAKLIRDNAARARKMTMPTGIKTETTDAKKKSKAPDAEYDKEAAKKICDMDCKKHYRMFLLFKMGLSRKQIAELLTNKCNLGQVNNALKLYTSNPHLESEMANKVAGGNVKHAKKDKAEVTEVASKPEQTEATVLDTEHPATEQPASEQPSQQAAD